MSYNRKALSKAKLDLDKYKKPNPYKKDILYTQEGQWKYPGQKTRIPSSDITMQGVPFPVFAQPNVGQPQMMYPGQEYSFPGASYVDEYPQMKKGGLVQMPKPSKKGLASKKYSRSLFATNKLFTENPLFKKPKSKKRKVFDPNAKYFESGGESDNNPPKSIVAKPSWYQEPVVNPAAYVSGFRGGNPNMYKYGFLTADNGNIIGGGGLGFPKSGIELSGLGVVPTSPLEREYFKGAYNAKISKDINRNLNLGLGVDTSITGYPGETGFVRDPIKFQPNLNLKYNFQPGGSVDVDVTEDDIAKYVNGGYIVEELPEMQPGGPFKPGTGYKMPALNKSEIAAVKKEVSKAKPVATKSTSTVKKPNSSNQVNKAKEDAAYEKFLDQNLGKEGSNTYTYVDPRTGKTEQREYSNAHLKDNGNISVDEATWNANRDRQNMQHLSEALSGVGEITGINSAIRTGERLINDPLKFADDLTTGISQAPETFFEGAMTLGSKLFGDNKDYVDVDTDALGVALDVAGSLPVVGTAGKVAKPVLKTGLKYLTTGPLRNAYKYNPWAFKPNPENIYRGIGKGGMEDAFHYGVIRNNPNKFSTEGIRSGLENGSFRSPYFVEGKNFNIAEKYGNGYIAETPLVRNAETGELAAYPAGDNWGWTGAEKEMPLKDFKILKKDWLRGYKEVPKNKKGGNINNYAPGGELSPEDLDPVTLEKYLSDLRGLENSIKKGYKNNKWYPHSSIEGGANTIAYGHKLQRGESFSSGLTEQQARDLQKKDVLAHQTKAEKFVDNKYGKGTYDKLPQNSQMLLTDYAYNLGSLNKFPSFVEGVVKGDKNKMLQQYERRGLNERNKWTKDVINTTDFSEDSDYGFNWMFDLDGWWNKKNGGAIELKIKNDKDLKRLIDQGYIIEEL